MGSSRIRVVTLYQLSGFIYNKTMKKVAFLAIVISMLFIACQTTINIPEDLSPAELIQRAQEASDRNQYNVALQYYQALYDRNQIYLDLVITAEYEIAFIYYKQKKYAEAREGMNHLLEYYNTPDQALLPQQFKRLAEIVLLRIDEKEAEQQFRFPWQKPKDTQET